MALWFGVATAYYFPLRVTVQAKTWLPQPSPAQRHFPPEAAAAGISGGFQLWPQWTPRIRPVVDAYDPATRS